MSADQRCGNHVPLRTCIVCGRKAAKRDLRRVVATPYGPVVLDTTGNRNGRGAYICGDGKCIGLPLSRKRVSFALRRSLSEADWGDLLSSVEHVTGRVVT